MLGRSRHRSFLFLQLLQRIDEEQNGPPNATMPAGATSYSRGTRVDPGLAGNEMPAAMFAPAMVREGDPMSESTTSVNGSPAIETSWTAEPFVPASTSLRRLQRAVQDCRGCPLYADTTQAVFGEGPARRPDRAGR